MVRVQQYQPISRPCMFVRERSRPPPNVQPCQLLHTRLFRTQSMNTHIAAGGKADSNYLRSYTWLPSFAAA